MIQTIEILLFLKRKEISYFSIKITSEYTEDIVSFQIRKNNLTPLGKMQDYFEIYHEFEFKENLNPRLRRAWEVAEVIDTFSEEYITGEY